MSDRPAIHSSESDQPRQSNPTSPAPPLNGTRRERVKWRSDAWLPLPGWVMTLAAPEDIVRSPARWVLVAAWPADVPGWIDVELAPE